MCVRVLHPRVEVTRSVVGWTAKEAGERQDGVVARVRHGLVAGDAAEIPFEMMVLLVFLPM